MTAPTSSRPPTATAPAWFAEAIGAERTDERIEVDGCPISYLEWGDRNRPGILLVHGFLAHAHCFAFIGPLLTPAFHVVAIDLSGMGDSGHRRCYEPRHRVNELVAVARATGMLDGGRRPFLVTHSYGSTVGIDTVAEHPGLFGGFAVCDLMMLPPELLQAHMSSSSRLGRGEARPHRIYPDLESAVARYRLKPDQQCDNEYLVRYIAEKSLTDVDGGYQWKFDPRVMVDDSHDVDWWIELPRRLAQLGGRRAIVHGAESALFTTDSRAYVSSVVGPRVPIVAIPHAHHHLMLDQPVAFAATVAALVSSWTAG